jgi:hypothetical protein
MSRFEVADTLRAETLARLPKERPWTQAANPADVASALEAFLVEEVPANAPDYRRLKPLGVDWVVEIVVEDFGMRSEDGRAGVYLVGHSRMFRTGGGEAYFRRFFSDEVRAKLEPLEPLTVAKNPTLFRDRLRGMLLAIAEQVAKDLSPEDRRAAPPDLATPDSVPPKQLEHPKERDDELPDPL